MMTSEAILKIPSMIETIHVKESPSMIDERPTMFSDRPSMLSESPTSNSPVENRNTFADRPSMVQDSRRDSDEGNSSNTDEKGWDNLKPLNGSKRGKRKKYQKYTPEDRFAIGKYCFEHGPAAARKSFQDRYPEMSESVTRGFRDKYKLIIGESAVYEFEQERQKENQQRSGPLPRGRPRKYRPVEEDEIPASMVIRNPSPPALNGEQNELQVYSSDQKIRGDQRNHYDRNFTKDESDRYADLIKRDHRIYPSEQYIKHREYTTLEKLKIGKVCAQEGLNSTLRRFKNEYPDLKEELVINFHKRYLESEGVSTNSEPQVFILESVDHPGSVNLKSIITTKPPITLSDCRPIYKESSENDRIGYEHNLDEHAVSKPQQKQSYLRGLLERSYRETNTYRAHSPSRSPPPHSTQHHSPPQRSPPHRSPPRDTTRPVVSIQVSSVVSSKVAAPIIHYPKPPIEQRSHESNGESRGVKREYSSAMETTKREYSSTMETNGYCGISGGYPYDKQPYEQSPPRDNVSNEGTNARAKRFKYQKYTPEDRYNIGKLCNEIGLGATVKVYREQFPRLNESVVRTFRNKYRELIQKGNGTPVTEAIERKPSRRSISSIVESDVISQLRQFKLSKIELSENLVIAVTENVIASKDPRETVGMRSLLTKEWANTLLWKHKLVEKPLTNANSVCCARCQTTLICPKCN